MRVREGFPTKNCELIARQVRDLELRQLIPRIRRSTACWSLAPSDMYWLYMVSLFGPIRGFRALIICWLLNGSLRQESLWLPPISMAYALSTPSPESRGTWPCRRRVMYLLPRTDSRRIRQLLPATFFRNARLAFGWGVFSPLLDSDASISGPVAGSVLLRVVCPGAACSDVPGPDRVMKATGFPTFSPWGVLDLAGCPLAPSLLLGLALRLCWWAAGL